MKSKVLIIAVVVILLGAFAWYWNNSQQAEASLITDENAVLVSDQQPSDETVVTYAKLAQSGYVVVYSTDAAGNKSVVGSSELMSAGEHRNVHVKHRNGAIVAGGTISAAIVVDDGDGSFSEESDTAVVAEDDAMISEDAELALNVSDEDLAALLEDAGYDLSAETEASVEEEQVTEENSVPATEETTEGAMDATIEVDAIVSPEEEMPTEESGA
ncbi:hypothetical protein KJ819_03515 [Patescibacteria group bacterium]|nr:hypothetical protein [Patescibacteria group bacterium]MBU1500537.1 hypothetical protein [Patescibacteria group bacterium]MBU2080426.1 hypothetical protein [Patescibacteria group bacterium]MBU2123769.1 hypothetical protein [Patescibacteria group bacterium]MBU2194625.1 hypothetical protein [Patescibacteria group bacterium]